MIDVTEKMKKDDAWYSLRRILEFEIRGQLSKKIYGQTFDEIIAGVKPPLSEWDVYKI